MNAPPASALTPLPVNDPAHAFIANAFDLAPILLQKRLCERIGGTARITLLIDEDNRAGAELGWSRWDPNKHAERYIALNRSFVNLPPMLRDYENNVLLDLLGTAADGAPLSNGPQIHGDIAITPPAADTQAMSVLSVIAHEMGHLLYSDTADANSNRSFVWRPNFCGVGQRFHANSWQNPNVGFGDGKFHGFRGNDASNTVASGQPSIWVVLADLKNNNNTGAAAEMLKIYGGSSFPKNWVNIFATVAKDEDFVETYRLMVLVRAQSTGFGGPIETMTMSIGNPPTPPTSANTVDIVANFSSSDLLDYKAKCITNQGLL
jgi:hypothetical protein